MSLLWLPIASIVSNIISGATSSSKGSSSSSSSSSSSNSSSSSSNEHQAWINNPSSGYGGMDNYVANQQARYNEAVASGDTDLLGRLSADAQRVGYTLTAPAANNDLNNVYGNNSNIQPQYMQPQTNNYEYFERRLKEQEDYYNNQLEQQRLQLEEERRQRIKSEQEEEKRQRIKSEQDKNYSDSYTQNAGLYGIGEKNKFYPFNSLFKKRDTSGAKIGIDEDGKSRAVSRYLAKDIWANR